MIPRRSMNHYSFKSFLPSNILATDKFEIAYAPPVYDNIKILCYEMTKI
jgi:hypothetical protein